LAGSSWGWSFSAPTVRTACTVSSLGLPVFLDLKLYDIPNTVARAMQAIHVLEPAIVTVHASGGRAMMEDAKAAAAEYQGDGVTMLTSIDDQ
jgi:orotidine-5'-phosphate decarboxylase